jgi:ATP-dependent DNA helicase DinG
VTAWVFCAAAKAAAGGWELGALRLGDGHIPLYRRFFFTAGPDNAQLTAFRAFSQDAYVLAHGGRDWEAWLLAQSAAHLAWVNTRELALAAFPTAGKYDLADLTFFLPLPAPRGGTGPWPTVRLTWELFAKIKTKALDFDLSILEQAAAVWADTPAGALCRFAAREVRRLAPERPILVEPPFAPEDEGLFAERTPERLNLPPQWVDDCFAPAGLLARHMDGFEERAEQRLMARAVTRGFSERKNIVAEAGTGTGKSAAYLLPAVWWARSKERCVVVATHTITLQEQLCRKDLPFLATALPFPFRFRLLKGRNNYCCRLRLRNEPPPDAPRAERLARLCLLIWARETQTGDLSELPQTELGPVWKKYNCEGHFCQPRHCGENSRCYMLRARRAAEKADLIVVNHSLLLADLNTENSVLPEHADLIVDEAHNFYAEAVRSLGFSFMADSLRRLLDLIGGKARYSLLGYYHRLAAELVQLATKIDWLDFARQAETLPELCRAAEQAGEDLFRLTESLLEQSNPLRLLPEKMGLTAFEAFGVETENLVGALGRLSAVLSRLFDLLEQEKDNRQLAELRDLLIRCDGETHTAQAGLSSLLAPAENWVPFLERSYTATLRNAPIDVGDILREGIFQKNTCNILTSATLSVGGSFTYFAGNIGLDEYIPLRLASPFNYREQLLFCLVDDLPLYGGTEENLAGETGRYLSRVAELAGGRTMVLFTSYRFLRLVAQAMRETESGLRVLAQGQDGTRESLLTEFKGREKSVLLGTGSFWEGVDLIGDSLTCLVMVKLPFLVPNQPLVEARAQKLEAQGRDPFYDLMLPEAVIRFKQGFGRLIRSTEDHGVFLLLDDRVHRKSYGRLFLRSLPITSYKKGSRDGVLRAIAERLGR